MPKIAQDFRFEPNHGKFSATTRFTWTGSGSGAMIIQGFGHNAADDFVFLYCNLKDDGAFEFPADIKLKLADVGDGQLQGASRINSRIETHGDASLLLMVGRTMSFGVY
jgi:hypothetical protein